MMVFKMTRMKIVRMMSKIRWQSNQVCFTKGWIMILLDGVEDDNDEVKIVRMMSTMAE